jgi:hypothetical protein
MSDEDDTLVDTLLHLLHIHARLIALTSSATSASTSSSAVNSVTPSAESSAGWLMSTIHPFALFYHFLSTLAFDHSVLIDFLISNETRFLDYLTPLLKRAVQGEERFQEMARICNEVSQDDMARMVSSVPIGGGLISRSLRSVPCFLRVLSRRLAVCTMMTSVSRLRVVSIR